jgi:hypothetical protein
MVKDELQDPGLDGDNITNDHKEIGCECGLAPCGSV